MSIVEDPQFSYECDMAWLVAEQEEKITSLLAFAADIMRDFADGDLDGGARQEIAIKHGLLIPEERTEPCGEFCGCREFFG